SHSSAIGFVSQTQPRCQAPPRFEILIQSVVAQHLKEFQPPGREWLRFSNSASSCQMLPSSSGRPSASLTRSTTPLDYPPRSTHHPPPVCVSQAINNASRSPPRSTPHPPTEFCCPKARATCTFVPYSGSFYMARNGYQCDTISLIPPAASLAVL